MPLGLVTVTTPGSFHFMEGQVIFGGWVFHNSGDRPQNEQEEHQLLKMSIAAVLDYIGGCLEMTNVPPVAPNDTLAEALTRDLISRAKGTRS